jgi:hypothetical protein
MRVITNLKEVIYNVLDIGAGMPMYVYLFAFFTSHNTSLKLVRVECPPHWDPKNRTNRTNRTAPTGLRMRVIANLNEVIYNALGIGPRLPKYICHFTFFTSHNTALKLVRVECPPHWDP